MQLLDQDGRLLLGSISGQLRVHEGPGGTEQALHRVHVQEGGLPGLGNARGAHCLLQHVDQGGVEALPRVVLGVVGFAPLDDTKLQDLLGGQQVEIPRVLGHSIGATVLARLR